MNSSTTGWLGCFWPAGGIIRPVSLLMTFSQVSGSSSGWLRSRVSNAKPPAQSVVLWHLSQMPLTIEWNGCSAASVAAALWSRAACSPGACCAATGWPVTSRPGSTCCPPRASPTERISPTRGTQAPARIRADLNHAPLSRIPPSSPAPKLSSPIVPLFDLTRPTGCIDAPDAEWRRWSDPGSSPRGTATGPTACLRSPSIGAYRCAAGPLCVSR